MLTVVNSGFICSLLSSSICSNCALLPSLAGDWFEYDMSKCPFSRVTATESVWMVFLHISGLGKSRPCWDWQVISSVHTHATGFFPSQWHRRNDAGTWILMTRGGVNWLLGGLQINPLGKRKNSRWGWAWWFERSIMVLLLGLMGKQKGMSW